VIGLGDAANRPLTSEITGVLCRQMSKTESMLNDIGQILDEDPRPLIYVGPTEKNVKSMSNDRVSKMIESTPALWAGLEKGQKNKTAEKFINGARLGFAWAGSPTELASHPAARIYVDERDRMHVTSEGDVDSIIQEAVATYAGLIIRYSTPLLGDAVRIHIEEVGREVWQVADSDDIASPIWQSWQEGSRHEWCFPCRHCDCYFAPHLDLLHWNNELPNEEVGKTARLVCPSCGSEHRNSDKEYMNSRGVFAAPDEKIKKNKKKAKQAKINGIPVMFGSYVDRGLEHLSFWVSGLCSPWSGWGKRAVSLKKAKESKEPSREQGVVNTQFGQVFKPKGQAPEWEFLKNLQAGYDRLTVPEGVKVITAGVDVHARRLNYVIRGWGVGYESWLLDYSELFGECKYLDDISWQQLREILQTPLGKKDIPIAMMLIDAGYKPNDDPAPANVIYQFCHANARALPAKGYDRRTRTHSATNIDISYKGKPVKEGLQMWHLDTDFFKSFIYGRYEWEEDAAGGWHLPAEVSDEYLRQASAESRIVLSNGTPKWEKIRQANHFLDCEMMATSAAHILRLHMLTDDGGEEEPETRRRSRKVYKGK